MQDSKEQQKFISQISQALDMTVELGSIIPALNFGHSFVGHARWPAIPGKGDFKLVVYTAQRLQKGFGPVRNNAWWIDVNRQLATPVQGGQNKGGVSAFNLTVLNQPALDYLGMGSYVQQK